MIKLFGIFSLFILSITSAAQENNTGTIKVKKIDKADNIDASPNSELPDAPSTAAPLAIVGQMPVFSGGDQAMVVFIKKNLKYPDAEKKNGTQGTVYVTFLVDTDGTIRDAIVIRGIPGGKACDQEALRVVNMMPKWIAGKQNGRVVAVQYNLPVKFVL